MLFNTDNFFITDLKNNTSNINNTITHDSTLQSSNQIDNSDLLNSSQEKSFTQEPEPVTTFLVKYTKLNKKNCFIMIEFKLIKSESSQFFKKQKNNLSVNCHEVAAMTFDNFYERIYSFENLCEENKYFKAFDRTEDIKYVIDDLFYLNQKKSNKIFLKFDNFGNLNLHLKLSYFDREKEIILTIPKKNISNQEKLILLPGLLKEIQDKMNYLQKENKKLRNQKPKIHMKLNRSNGFIDFKKYEKTYLLIENEKKNSLLTSNLKKIIHNVNRSVEVGKNDEKEKVSNINYSETSRKERIRSNKRIKRSSYQLTDKI